MTERGHILNYTARLADPSPYNEEELDLVLTWLTVWDCLSGEAHKSALRPQEADAMNRLDLALTDVIKAVNNPYAPDDTFAQHPLWVHVVTAAQEVLDTARRLDPGIVIDPFWYRPIDDDEPPEGTR